MSIPFTICFHTLGWSLHSNCRVHRRSRASLSSRLEKNRGKLTKKKKKKKQTMEITSSWSGCDGSVHGVMGLSAGGRGLRLGAGELRPEQLQDTADLH